jgi:hypothetical protein
MRRREQNIKERENTNIRTLEIEPEILEKILGSQQESKRKGKILIMIQKKLAPPIPAKQEKRNLPAKLAQILS